VLEIGHGSRSPYNVSWQPPKPLVPRTLRHDDIVAARSQLWSEFRIAAEHGAAAAYAALTSGAHVPEPGERVAVVVCGANTDPTTLGSGISSD